MLNWFRRRRRVTPASTPSGTRIIARKRPAITYGNPTLFKVYGSTSLVYITWGEQVLFSVVKRFERGHFGVTTFEVESVVAPLQPGGLMALRLPKNKFVQVPPPGVLGGGTWGHQTLEQLDVNGYRIKLDRRTGAPISIVPK